MQLYCGAAIEDDEENLVLAILDRQWLGVPPTGARENLDWGFFDVRYFKARYRHT
jgi:hypothetical protein